MAIRNASNPWAVGDQVTAQDLNDTVQAIPKFGGTGADGALSITSGATNIDLANASVVTKNYTSISITGTGSLTFTNPHANGTIIILKSQGNITLTSSTAPMIACQNLGASGGAGAVISGGTNQGSAGSNPNSNCYHATDMNGGGGKNNGGAGSGVGGIAKALLITGMGKFIPMVVGAGGGGGGDGGGGTAGAGGRGGGGLYIECAGAWNFTTASGISVAGQNGTNGTTSAGGGGGGGGFCVVRYNTLTANSGTITVSGGSGGTSGGAGGGGNGGASQINGGGTSGVGAVGGAGGAGWSSVGANTDFT